jgi:hypothetical protein
MPPLVSFVAIGLFVATIGFSIGLDADIFAMLLPRLLLEMTRIALVCLHDAPDFDR